MGHGLISEKKQNPSSVVLGIWTNVASRPVLQLRPDPHLRCSSQLYTAQRPRPSAFFEQQSAAIALGSKPGPRQGELRSDPAWVRPPNKTCRGQMGLMLTPVDLPKTRCASSDTWKILAMAEMCVQSRQTGLAS